MTVTAQRLAGADFSIQTPKEEKAPSAYVFTVADLIPADVKFKVPSYRKGGLIRSNFLTLKYRDGYIRKCEITQLRQQMESEQDNFINPSERKHLLKTYNIVEGDRVQTVGLKSTRNIHTGEMEIGHDHLLRTAFYPSDEIDRLTGQADGIVKMPSMSAAQAEEAQYFLFPDWDTNEPPVKVADIRNHLRQRLTDAQGLRNAFLIEVCNQAILSCDQYEAAGRAEIANANAKLAEASTKGWAWTYGSDAEAYFEQLGIQRKDQAVQDNANKMDKLVEVLSNAFQNKPASTPSLDDAKAILEAHGLKVAEVSQEIAEGVEPISVLLPVAEEALEFDKEDTEDFPVKISTGQGVKVGDEVGVVTDTRFGRIKVQFAEGDIRQVEKSSITEVIDLGGAE